jgi:uncharacterized membrane protein
MVNWPGTGHLTLRQDFQAQVPHDFVPLDKRIPWLALSGVVEIGLDLALLLWGRTGYGWAWGWPCLASPPYSQAISISYTTIFSAFR